MCRKIRCDRESWKLFGFWGELNKALEIKDKKEVENSFVDHLSRMQFENPQEVPIDNSLRDNMLYEINRSDPWYVDIVNFMVTGYVPPGGNKRKLIQ